MPCFINNKGASVLTSLLSWAIVNDGLTGADIERIPPGLKSRVLDARRRLGYEFPRSLHRTPIYLEKDVSALFVPHPTIRLCRTSQPDDEYMECVRPRTNPDENASRPDVENWPQLSNKIQSCVRDIVVVFFRNDRKGSEILALSSVRTKTNAPESKPLALEVTSTFLRWLTEDGVDTHQIQRLVVEEPVERRIPVVCLNAMPRLTHLDINSYVIDLAPLLRLKHTLEVLRVLIWVEMGRAGTFEKVLSQMISLRLLVSTFSPAPYAIEWSELKLSESLRSIVIIGVNPGTTADVVSFLTSEVDSGEEVVARQHLLDDFTIIGGMEGMIDAAMDGVYLSEALSQRMKDRIFCTTTIGHVTSALQLLVRRSEYGNSAGLDKVVRIARSIVRRTAYHQPHPILLSVLLDLTRHSVSLKIDFRNVVSFMQELLRTKCLVEMYDPQTSLCVEETAIRIGRAIHYGRVNGPILRADTRIADECDVIPEDIYNVLIVLTSLMHVFPAFLESVFLKRVKKLEPSLLPNLFEEIKESMCWIIMKQVSERSPTRGRVLMAIRDQNVTNEMIELLTFINEKATAEVADLLVATNAVLRRSDTAPLSDAQLADDDGQRELELLQRTFSFNTQQVLNL